MHRVPKLELEARMAQFRSLMEQQDADWQIAYIFTKIGQYYLTGTMQDGVLIIPRNAEATLWVRVSYDRAVDESNFASIKPMRSYRDAGAAYDQIPEVAYVEKDFLPMAMWDRFAKYFPTKQLLSVGPVMSAMRSVKSDYEMEQMRASGELHREVLEEIAPTLFREGISEAELNGELFNAMIKAGHHGVARFGMYDTNVVLGHVAFGESATYPTNFDGPGGNLGLSPAVPFLGSRERLLKKGDMIFLDVAVGINGYHTDKTMTYIYGAEPSAEVVAEHQKCLDIQLRTADLLRPGNTPEEVHQKIMESLSPDFLPNFMGFGNRQVKFLGHSVGLFIDEAPAIARGFKAPIVENMCFAIEPKKGIAGVGVVGVEDTFVVTADGAKSITGSHPGLMRV